jgi:hypothetical protein
VFIATAFAAMGEKDQAFIWLEESYNEHDPDLTVLNALPFFDTLRGDPRFRDLVRRIGIPTQ